MISKNVKIITHNGSFHADEVFAVATLKIMLGRRADIVVIRSREPEVWKSADYLVDVGGVYDASKNYFDHHQEGGAGGRENGIDYSSFGLVWKTYGEIVCGSKEVADLLDQRMVTPVDAVDNGQDIFDSRIPGLFPYDVSSVISVFRPSVHEDISGIDKAFDSAVGVATLIINREIIHARGEIEGRKIIRQMIEKAEDKRIAEIDHNYAWEPVTYEFSELLYVYYQTDPEVWRLKTARVRPGSFESKKLLPENWAGKTGKELTKITGVPDAIFCHRKRFLCGAKTKKGILKLAELALKT